MTDRDRRNDAPQGGAMQPPEIPHETTDDDALPTPAAGEDGPIPDMPISRDPFLNPGPVPINSPRPLD